MTEERQTISVVIPTWNEEAELDETLRRARRVPEFREFIVVDGGSEDATTAIAERHGCRTLRASPGRGGQLRRGSEAATGDVILMLHADTWVEPDAGAAILLCQRDARVVGGALLKEFRGRVHWLMRGGAFRCRLRMALFRRVLGDQGLFVRRETLRRIGGAPDTPLMEEYEICRRLRREGRLALADSTVTTSARKFERLGVARTYLRMAWVTTLYHAGVAPERLREIYQRD